MTYIGYRVIISVRSIKSAHKIRLKGVLYMKYKEFAEILDDVLEKEGWGYDLEEDEKENVFHVDIWVNSPEGVDYCISLNCLRGDAINELVKGLEEEYEGFDVSEETYYYLDNSGHGIFDAPYDMKDAYEDMAAIKEIIKKLAEVFKKVKELLIWL